MKKTYKSLRLATKRWYSRTCNEYALDEHHRRTLLMAATMWDRACEAREAIARDGACVPDRFGQLKPHPSVGIEKEATLTFLKCLRELALDFHVNEEFSRPTRAY